MEEEADAEEVHAAVGLVLLAGMAQVRCMQPWARETDLCEKVEVVVVALGTDVEALVWVGLAGGLERAGQFVPLGHMGSKSAAELLAFEYRQDVYSSHQEY